jgi:Domain of unknown function (DUF4258)
MSETLARVRALAARGDVRPSLHAYRELAADGILFEDIVAGLGAAVAIEDYPDYFKGPSVLALHKDADGRPVHALWGIPKDQESPAVLVTVYRPNPSLWSANFTIRRRP